MAINTVPHIHNLVICANVFVRKDGKYLLLKRSPHKRYAPNFIHPIGGKIDRDENPYTGAERELLEEAGIKVKNMRLEAVIMEIKPVKGEEENWLIFHFSADYDFGKILTTEEGEFIFLSREEILAQDLFPSLKPIIGHILNPKDGTVFFKVTYDDKGKVVETTKNIDLCVV
ncbi:MAG: NUDIX domain-containing protein [Patescibacteria group bacterium]|nr:NUDIX domain-containing protein [Patescibacteria group bacterium]